jgi:hypothetical protein
MGGLLGFNSPPAATGGSLIPGIDPGNQANLTASDLLNEQTSADQLATLHVQMQDNAISTAQSIRQMIESTVQGVANQAISTSQAFIGDEISQAKKGISNSEKAV